MSTVGVRNIKNEHFEKIVETYYKLVYKICFDVLKDTFEAENISQETFLSLYKNFYKYSCLKDNDLKNLICKIALNKCKDYLKSYNFKLVKTSNIDDDFNKSVIQENSLDENLIKKERQLLIKRAVNELKSPYKEVITEYYFNGLSLDEISIKLNRDKAVIKTQLYRSKKILKENLKGGDLFE